MSDIEQPDIDLMNDLDHSTSRAMQALVDRWQKPVASFINRYVNNTGTCKELTQETFVRVYLNRKKYNPKYKFSSWIFTIAANLCKNHYRWKKRHPESFCVDYSSNEDNEYVENKFFSHNDNASAYAEKQDEFELLKAQVEALPHDLKTSLLLHYYEGLSYQDISKVVGCSLRGVETRLYRARKILKQKLERQKSD